LHFIFAFFKVFALYTYRNDGDTEMKTFNEIASEYAPYHTLPAFRKGTEDYMDSKFDCPFTGWADAG
jgi:hypothetical protein